ncbi:MAG: hypothetical protein LBG47_08875 [Prevotellaceae bacterium]|nr:hypothetical protein [Prevotellaceae bacterium]
MAVCFSCGKDEITSLAGTKWKLTGFVDATTNASTTPMPKDCKECFTLTFDTEYTAIAHSITLSMKLDLMDLNPDRMIGYMAELYDPNGHGWDFRVAIAITESFSLINNELKLFYYGNKNYLLFKHVK